MAFSGLVLAASARELKDKIVNARIEKIYQPTKHELFLTLYRESYYRLLVSAHPMSSRIHLTEQKKENPLNPPPFCMLLRKHLTGGRITSIQQVGLDRILRINIRTRDEFEIIDEKILLVEIMGKHSNIILLDKNNIILGSIKTVTKAVSRYRTIVPGKTYTLPPYQGKINLNQLKEFSPNMLIRALSEQPEKNINKALITVFNGLDPLLAEEIAARASLDSRAKIKDVDSKDLKQLKKSLESVRNIINNNDFCPVVLLDEKGNYKDFTCIDLIRFPLERKVIFENMSMMLENFFSCKDKRQKYEDLKQGMLVLINNKLEKIKVKQAKLSQKLKKAEKGDDLRLWGELLTSQLYLAVKGQKEIELVNFYHPQQEKITVPLDSRISPAENAQKFFKYYRKYKRAVPLLKKEMKNIEAELKYLEGIMFNLERGDLEDIKDIKEELTAEGYFKRSFEKKRKTRIRVKPDIPRPVKYLSSDGFEIYVGKNNIQNEYLTLKMASKEDLWFHVKDIPGAHVVVKGDNVTGQTLLEAALLAAYYSRGSDSANVPVDYTKIKHVRKPKQAKPGMVIYDHHKTLYVTPEERIVQELKKNN